MHFLSRWFGRDFVDLLTFREGIVGGPEAVKGLLLATLFASRLAEHLEHLFDLEQTGNRTQSLQRNGRSKRRNVADPATA